jgi:2-amino-4-hydroxy-6-hydroxymethyldihydropteridine diphosphokinase
MSLNFDIFFKDLPGIGRRNPERVFLGLGSNVGDRAGFLKTGIERIRRFPKTRVVRVSSVYETEPWGGQNQADFLNQAVEIETRLDPKRLLKHCKAVERFVGSTKPWRWGPRRLDVDILVYGSLVCRTVKLGLPHPRLAERRFALAPLAEIAPALAVPGSGRTAAEALSDCNDPCGVQKWNPAS